jgi:hypothetical protein
MQQFGYVLATLDGRTDMSTPKSGSQREGSLAAAETLESGAPLPLCAADQLRFGYDLATLKEQGASSPELTPCFFWWALSDSNTRPTD